MACTGASCTEAQTYSNGSDTPALGLDLLARVTPGLRLGVATQLVPDSTLSIVTSNRSIGSDLSVRGVVEGAIAVGPFALHLRGQVGMVKLFQGGALTTFADQKRGECSAAKASGTVTSCSVDVTSGVGLSYGLGIGGSYAIGRTTALRVDLLYEAHSVTYLHRSAKGPGLDASSDNTLESSRTWLLAGVELGIL